MEARCCKGVSQSGDMCGPRSEGRNLARLDSTYENTGPRASVPTCLSGRCRRKPSYGLYELLRIDSTAFSMAVRFVPDISLLHTVQRIEQHRDIVLDSMPNNRQPDVEVVVCGPIAKPCDFLPRYLWLRGLRFRTQLLSRFSQYLETVGDCKLECAIVEKFVTPTLRGFLNVVNTLQHMLNQRGVP